MSLLLATLSAAAAAAAAGGDNDKDIQQQRDAALHTLAAAVSAAKQWAPSGPTLLPNSSSSNTPRPAAAAAPSSLPQARRVANAALLSASQALAAVTGCGGAPLPPAHRPRGAAAPNNDADSDADAAAATAARAALVGQLLRLAACGPSAQFAGASTSWSSDRACAAALAALESLPAEELGRLSDADLAAAALVKPTLIDELTEAAAASACGSGRGRGDAGGAGALDEVLSAHAAWARLPSAVLAEQPAAFRRVAATLLAWWKLSGHPRLWQLLGRACRPVWLQLLQVQPSGVQQQQQQQPLPDAALEALFCDGAPLALARLLAQAPSRLAMRQLLAALPGCAAPAPAAAAVADAQEAAAAAADDDADDNDGWLARGWPSDHELWGGWGGERSGSSGSSAAAAAWRLAMQHPCWREYAAWVLAHTSLQLRAMPPAAAGGDAAANAPAGQQQQQQTQQQVAPTQACLPGTQQRPRSAGRPISRADAAQDAADAAALLAWLAAPGDPARQRLIRASLAGCATADTGAEQQQQQQDEPEGQCQAGELDAAAATARAASSLLEAWGAAAAAGGGAWPWWLASLALPLALLQHPAVQLHGCSSQVFDAYFGPQALGGGGSGDNGSSGSSESGALMRALKAGQARDALRAVSGAAAELLQSEGGDARSSQAAAGGSQAVGANKRSNKQRTWLAACVRHALVSWPVPLPLAAQGADAAGDGGRQRPLVARLRLLHAAIEHCEAAITNQHTGGSV